MLGYALLIALVILFLLVRKRWRARPGWANSTVVRVTAFALVIVGTLVVLLNADELNPRADLIPYLRTIAGLILFGSGMGIILWPKRR